MKQLDLSWTNDCVLIEQHNNITNLLDYLYQQKYYELIGITYQDKQIQVFLKKLILQEN